MPEKFQEPEFPFVHKFTDGLKKGHWVKVVAQVKDESPDRFVFQLATSDEEESADIININVKFAENELIFNHCLENDWKERQIYKNGLHKGDKFQLLVLVRRDRFEIKYKGELYTYPHHIEPEKLKVIRVKNFEGINCQRIVVSSNENEEDAANASGEE